MDLEYILGNDIASVVTAVGSSVSKVRVGDCVIACSENAAFQLASNVEQTLVTRLPENVRFTDRAVLPLALCTAVQPCTRKGSFSL